MTLTKKCECCSCIIDANFYENLKVSVNLGFKQCWNEKDSFNFILLGSYCYVCFQNNLDSILKKKINDRFFIANSPAMTETCFKCSKNIYDNCSIGHVSIVREFSILKRFYFCKECFERSFANDDIKKTLKAQQDDLKENTDII